MGRAFAVFQQLNEKDKSNIGQMKNTLQISKKTCSWIMNSL